MTRSQITDHSAMRLMPALATIAAICLIAVALPAVPVQAQCIPRPQLSIEPNSGVPGDTITVRGEFFGPENWVDIHYAGVHVKEVRANSVGRFTTTIEILDSPRGRHDVMAEAEALEADITHAAATFTVWPGLTVSPAQGPAGTTVTVTGRGFVRNETILDVRYYLAASHETFADSIVVGPDGRWEATFQVPPSARGEHKIDAWGSQTIRAAVRPTAFAVVAGISVGTSSGSAGQTVTIRGSGFAPGEQGIRILFHGSAVETGITADLRGEWQAIFEVPEMPKGSYTITAEGEQTRQRGIGELSFAIGSGIVLSPTEGHVGMELTVTGRGFAASRDVIIFYDDGQVETARTDQQGRFEVTFPVPESPRGERVVKAKTATDSNGVAAQGTNVSAVFTMESDPPPLPRAISPADGARVGFIYRATPTLEWSNVEDPSGVYYTLQLSASKEVTADGAFVDPIVSEKGLTVTSYALETDALPYGRYYWIVRAVDGAGNESPWSEVRSFRAGLLPKWGFIAAIVVLGIILLALIRVAIIRRTYYY